jgi:hypothetical protein
MADIVPVLSAKRAELVGVIAELERTLCRHRADLAHIDGTIRLFSPAAMPDPAGSKTAGPRQRRFRPGELARGILDVLRRAGRPLTAGEIGAAFMDAKGMAMDDPAGAAAVCKLVLRGLAYHERRRVVAGAGRDGRTRLWRLAD